MKQSRKIVLAGLVVAVIIAVSVGFMPKPVPVEVAKARRGLMRVTLEEEGKTRVKDRFVISAPVAGFLNRIKLDAGDAVRKNLVIAELSPLRSEMLDPRNKALADARVKTAEAALKAAKENMRASGSEADYAEAELKRIKKLYESAFISKKDFEIAETRASQTRANYRSSRFAVKVAEYELEEARTVLKYQNMAGDGGGTGTIKVLAPVDGYVLKVLRESEGVVNPGEPLIEIGDPRSLEVEIDVLSEDAVKITHGTRVFFKRWGGSSELEGKVRVVEPFGFTKVSALGVEEQRVLVISDIASQHEVWERLGDGYRLEAEFILWEGDNVLQAPGSALFRYNEGWAVFVHENRRARQRIVKIGHRGGLNTEIISGLSEGEEVITHPNDSVKDGARVKLR